MCLMIKQKLTFPIFGSISRRKRCLLHPYEVLIFHNILRYFSLSIEPARYVKEVALIACDHSSYQEVQDMRSL